PYSHRGLAMVERFNKTEGDMLYKIQYAIESISSEPRLIRAWRTGFREPGSSKWGLAPSEAILLKKVESRPSVPKKRAIEKD
ncbi:14265_t:CDS:2, partial [Gigaspora rosea]